MEIESPSGCGLPPPQQSLAAPAQKAGTALLQRVCLAHPSNIGGCVRSVPPQVPRSLDQGVCELMQLQLGDEVWVRARRHRRKQRCDHCGLPRLLSYRRCAFSGSVHMRKDG